MLSKWGKYVIRILTASIIKSKTTSWLLLFFKSTTWSAQGMQPSSIMFSLMKLRTYLLILRQMPVVVQYSSETLINSASPWAPYFHHSVRKKKKTTTQAVVINISVKLGWCLNWKTWSFTYFSYIFLSAIQLVHGDRDVSQCATIANLLNNLKNSTLPLASPFYSCIALLFSEKWYTCETNEKAYLIHWN